MNQVPHITIEQASILYTNAEPILKLSNELIDKHNARIDKANAEQEQPLISAEEARKLGAGNAEWSDKHSGGWVKIDGVDHDPRYEQVVKVEPTCQVRNEDTGEFKTMTREAAKKLQAETKDTCDWFVPNSKGSIQSIFEFTDDGIYTYKQKANLVKLDGELMTREAAIAKWESKKDTHTMHFQMQDGNPWFEVYGNKLPKDPDSYFQTDPKVKFELRAKPLKQVSWKDVPVGVAVKPKSDPIIWLLHGRNRIGQAVLSNKGSDTCDKFCAEFESLELAPASEQPWIAVQDGETGYGAAQVLRSKGLQVKMHQSHEKYRITGLAEGYELK